MNIKNLLRSFKSGLDNNESFEVYKVGLQFYKDPHYLECQRIYEEQRNCVIKRTDVINFVLTFFKESRYLEIGVRNPNHNFNLINCQNKYSVDPGIEFGSNPVDFNMTSDDFFNELKSGNILSSTTKFDVIFIDGMHLANQVEKDIENSLEFLSDKGFIILHDCNPPTEFHASENYNFKLSPSRGAWNGTVWKAFTKIRNRNDLNSCCIDTDWGIGIISKNIRLMKPSHVRNPFYEYKIFSENRSESLGLLSFDRFKTILKDYYSD